MNIENPSIFNPGFVGLACFLLALTQGALAWHGSRGKLKKVAIAVLYLLCVFTLSISVFFIYLSTCTYQCLSVSPDGKKITLTYSLIRSPLELQTEQLKTINIKQEWTSRKFGPEDWYEVIPETKDGRLSNPEWSISAKNEREFSNLTLLVDELKRMNLPLHFTYKDKYGKTHETQSLLERPGNDN